MIGNQIGKGSNAAVYEAAALKERPGSLVQPREEDEEGEPARSLTCCSLKRFPLALKMMWNFGVGVLRYSPLLEVGPTCVGHKGAHVSTDRGF